MQLLAFTVAATCAMVFSYTILGFGGPICALIFLAILFTGATLRIAQPLLDQLKP